MNELTEMNLFLFITNLVTLALCGALLPVIPLLTRRAFLFGIRVPEAAQADPEAKLLKRRYVTVCICGTVLLLVLAVAQYLLWPDKTLLALMYFPLMIIPLQMLAFVPCHRRAKRLKAERRWSVSVVTYAETRSAQTRGRLSNVPWIYYVVSLIIIIASACIALAKYPDMPDPIPTHFNFSMQPDAWAAKSLIVALISPLVNLGMLVIFVPVAISIEKVRLQISTEDPALSFAQHRMYRRRMGHACGILALGCVIGILIMGLASWFNELMTAFTIIFATALMTATIIPIVVTSIASGQGGCRLKPRITDADRIAAGVAPGAPQKIDSAHADDRFWALGMFYHNPDDPAILVEDRFGVNMGFNYSHLGVKIGVALMVAALVGLYVWMTVIFKTLGVS